MVWLRVYMWQETFYSNHWLNLIGNEYRVLILSTSEPIKEDGSPTIDPSKSLCNPHVFNTAITRAQNLVIAVGNPTNLLRTEKVMVRDPKYAHSGHCWSNFIKHCIEKDAISFSHPLEESDSKENNVQKIVELVQHQLGTPVSINDIMLGLLTDI